MAKEVDKKFELVQDSPVRVFRNIEKNPANKYHYWDEVDGVNGQEYDSIEEAVKAYYAMADSKSKD